MPTQRGAQPMIGIPYQVEYFFPGGGNTTPLKTTAWEATDHAYWTETLLFGECQYQ